MKYGLIRRGIYWLFYLFVSGSINLLYELYICDRKNLFVTLLHGLFIGYIKSSCKLNFYWLYASGHV